MVRPIVVLAVLLAAAWMGCAIGADSRSPMLTYSGYGAVRFGMRLAEAESALGEKSKPQDRDTANDPCRYVIFDKYAGVSFMLENDRIVRADLDRPAINILGLTFGMKLSYVREHYPQVIVQPGPDESHELVFKSPGEAGEILAIEWDGVVMGIRGGIMPAVGYVEGCL